MFLPHSLNNSFGTTNYRYIYYYDFPFFLQVKYKKHKKATRNGRIKLEKSPQHMTSIQAHQLSSSQHHIHNHTQLQHQQTQVQNQQQQQSSQQKFNVSPVNNSEHGVPSNTRPHLINGTILKTALTNPSEVIYGIKYSFHFLNIIVQTITGRRVG